MREQPRSWSTASPNPADQDTASGPRLRTLGRWASAARPVVAAVAALTVVVAAQIVPAQRSASGGWTSSAPIHILAGDARRPTPTSAPGTRPLGTPWRVPAAGPYTFIAVQPSSDRPVAYDPCRPLTFVVNERTMPPGAAGLVGEAVELIHDVTGLQFTFEGATDEGPVAQRPAFQPGRYGDRWAPILIVWSDSTELVALQGDIAGVAGSTAVPTEDRGPEVYVSGMVALDGPQLAGLLGSRTGAAQVRAVVLHELGHLLGLDHVEDPSQLMHSASGATSLQQGDLAGLVELGVGPCVPRL